jgi:alanine racemase
VGYGVNVVPEDGVIAVLPLGYGDGLPTQAAGHRFHHAGFEARIFGRVNMDMCFLFFPTAALGRVKVGDEVRLWDAHPAALQSYADHMETHAYQAMCAISGRVPRVYPLN